MSSAAKWILLVLGAGLAVLVVLAIGLKILGGPLIEDTIAGGLQTSTGEEVDVDGQFELNLFSTEPGVTAQSIAIKSQAEGAVTSANSTKPAASIGEFKLAIDPLASLQNRQLIVSELTVADVHLSLNSAIASELISGTSDQTQDPGQDSATNPWWLALPTIKSLTIKNVQAHYVSPENNFVQFAAIDILEGFINKDEGSQLEVQARSRVASEAGLSKGAGEISIKAESPDPSTLSWSYDLKQLPLATGLVGASAALLEQAPVATGSGSDSSRLPPVMHISGAGNGSATLPANTTQSKEAASGESALAKALQTNTIEPSQLELVLDENQFMRLDVQSTDGTLNVDALFELADYRANAMLQLTVPADGESRAITTSGETTISKTGLEPLTADWHGALDIEAGQWMPSSIRVDKSRWQAGETGFNMRGGWNNSDDRTLGDASVSVEADIVELERFTGWIEAFGAPLFNSEDPQTGESAIDADSAAKPAEPLNQQIFGDWPDLQAAISVSAQQLKTQYGSIDKPQAAIALTDSRLTLSAMDTAQTIDTSVSLARDASEQSLRALVKAKLDELPLAPLATILEAPALTTARLSGRASLATSLAQSQNAPAGAAALWARLLSALQIDAFDLRLRAPQNLSNLQISIDQPDAESPRPLTISGDGRFRGEPFELSGTLGDLDAFVTDSDWTVDLGANLLSTDLSAQGTISAPAKLKGLDVQVRIAGPNPDRLNPVLPVPLPNLPPYQFEGELARDGQAWLLNGFTATVGDSDAHGDIRWINETGQPSVYANVISNRLDMDDLAGLIGATPDAQETVSDQQAALAREQAGSSYVLPRADLDLAGIARAFEGRIDYRARTVDTENFPVADFELGLTVDKNTFTVDPLDFSTGGGIVSMRVALDDISNLPRGDFVMQINDVNIDRLMPDRALTNNTAGVANGRTRLWFEGRSIGEMLGTADGGGYLLMTGGSVDKLLLEAVGVDPLEALATHLLADDRAARLRCTWIDYRASDGIFELNAALADTEDSLVLAQGSLTARTEQLNMVIEAKPKDFSLLSAPAAFNLLGTLNDPIVLPDESLVGTVATAAALTAAAGPAAALLPLLTPGSADSTEACNTLEQALGQAD